MRPYFLASALMLWAAVAGAQFAGPGGAVPVVANNPGLNQTLWRSDVSITNLEGHPTSVVLLLYPEIVDGVPAFAVQTSAPVPLAANGQVTMANILQTTFGVTDVKGGLSVISTDGTPVLISSRVYNVLAGGGSYGQDAQAMLVAETAYAGGLEHDGFFRTNIGIFLPVNPPTGQQIVFTVTIRSADGTVVGSGDIAFNQAGVVQQSLSTFGVNLLVDGWATISCSDPGVTWNAYASRVDQFTGDPVFRPFRGFATSLP
jgi:hypothetical protein